MRLPDVKTSRVASARRERGAKRETKLCNEGGGAWPQRMGEGETIAHAADGLPPLYNDKGGRVATRENNKNQTLGMSSTSIAHERARLESGGLIKEKLGSGATQER